VVDAVLETTVVGSFSRVGYEVRSRLGRWPAHDRRLRLDGRTVVVTGATSGIGLAAASRCAQLGADVRFVARSRERAERARDRIELAAGRGAEVAYELADVSDLSAVRELAAGLSASVPRIDVLVHNAGALTRTPSTTADGSQLTLAAHVLGPFLLTGLLLDRLRGAAPARVITVSSGGMYTERLDVADLEMDPAGYDGRVAYARAKRAQVALTHEWASRVPSREVRFHSMHPGWVDTPGLAAGMPAFRRVMRPLLRTPEQGADTVVWLASVEDELPNGSFWHDRRPRSEHRVPSTRVPDQGAALWAFCQERTGWAGP
jgi:NAD(P)-dependent dehydrogenase (short-subunit alcohol dehydrogenase family)